MKDEEIYTKEELDFFMLIKNQEITETPPEKPEKKVLEKHMSI